MTEARDQAGETAPAGDQSDDTYAAAYADAVTAEAVTVLRYSPDGSDPLGVAGGAGYVVVGDEVRAATLIKADGGRGELVDHAFVPGGDDSTFGAAGTWCAAPVERDGEPDQCGRPPEAHAGAAAAGWDCQAYGPEGTKHGALCFYSPELGERDCRTADQCAQRMVGERRRVYGRISEMAAHGDPVGEYLAEAFGGPDDLLGGFGGRERVPLVEAVKRATTRPEYEVARLECAPDVVEYLHSVAAKEEPAPPWQPAPIVPLQAVSVVVDADMPAGRWRMVTAGGDVVWEGTVEQGPGPAPER